MHRYAAILCLALTLSCLAVAARAARLSGTVTDDKGAPLAAVVVEARSPALGGTTRAATTDAAGRFEISGLPGGTYAISATMSGLPPVAREGVVVAEGSDARVGFTINLSVLTSTLAEVNVTARRVTETAQEAPITVTAVPQQVVDVARVQTVDQFVQLVPNATLPTDPYAIRQDVNIRGVTALDSTAEPGVGLFRNGQYYGSILTNVGNMVDVERVEVMRGPQGGLYGRNSLGGAMNIVVATPRSETDVVVDTKYASFNRLEGSAVVNVPLVPDRFLVRAVGWSFSQTKGEHYNAYLQQQMDESHDRGGRLGATWIPSDKVTVQWQVEGQSMDGPENTVYFRDRGESKGAIYRDTPSTNDRRARLFSQDIVWSTGLGDLTLAASHRTNGQDTLSDQDFTTAQPSDYPGALKEDIRRHVDAKNSFAELRWASPRNKPLTAVAGVSYYKENLDYNRFVDIWIDLSLIGYGTGVETGRGNIITTIATRSTSAFAEATWAATPKLSFIGSVRYTRDQKTLAYDQSVSSTNPIIPLLFAGALPTITSRDAHTFTNTSPGVGLDYRFDANRSLYARVSTGFRAGGYNTVVSDPKLLAYDAETSTNYEVGFKSEWMNKRLRANIALFRFDQKHLALRREDPLVPTFSYLQNAGAARTDGFELEVAARPIRGLDLYCSYGWLDGKLADALLYSGPGQPLTDLKGARILDTPKYTGTFMVLYQKPIATRTNLVLNASYRVRGDLPQTYLGNLAADPYKLLSASVGVDMAHWRLSVFGDNLTDDQGVIALVWAPTIAIDTRMGRTFGVRAGYRFR